MLGSLFQQTPEKAAATVEKFAAEHDAVAQRLAAARTAYGAALVDEADGLADSKTVTAMRLELADLENEVAAKSAALVEARRRHQQAIATAQGNVTAAQWAGAAAIAGKRHKAALRLAEASQSFASAYRALIDANAELHQALPAMPDPDAAMLSRADIERALQLDLWRNGCLWAIAWPWTRDDIEPLADRFKGATAVVEAWASPHRH